MLAMSVANPPADHYMCPLCLMLFDRDELGSDTLTFEHVPPSSVSGRKLVLLCEPCNSVTGSGLDNHLKRYDNLVRFGTASAVPLPGIIRVAGVSNRGQVCYDGTTWFLNGVPRQNRVSEREAFGAAISAAGNDTVIDLTVGVVVDERRALLAWTKAAYLAAFAVLGYRYVLQDAFDPLRAALKTPDVGGFEPVVFHSRSQTSTEMRLITIGQPEWLAGCVGLIMGSFVVILPPARALPNFFEAFTAVHRQHASDSFSFVSSQYSEPIVARLFVMDRWLAEPMYQIEVAPAVR